MRLEHNRYVEAVRADIDTLQKELNETRDRLERSDRSTMQDSRLLETVWTDLEDRWRRLQDSSDTASTEARKAYEDARHRFRKVLDSYHGN